MRPLRDEIPPVEPASVPHTNCPALQVNFPVPGSQVVLSPEPKKLEVEAVEAKSVVAVALPKVEVPAVRDVMRPYVKLSALPERFVVDAFVIVALVTPRLVAVALPKVEVPEMSVPIKPLPKLRLVPERLVVEALLDVIVGAERDARKALAAERLVVEALVTVRLPTRPFKKLRSLPEMFVVEALKKVAY